MNAPEFESLRPLLTEPSSLVTNLTGFESYFKDATERTSTPAAVLVAQSRDDVIAAVRFCNEHHIPITPRGAGTGLSGGCVPSSNSLVISTERLVTLDVIPSRYIAYCGPGVITKKLLDAAASHSLTYPPDPASYEESSIGGNVAEGAGGLRCKRYGVTKDYILGLEAVTVDGKLLQSGIYNDQQGFNIEDVLIASEGTLAIITEIAVQLIPSPGRGTTILAAFSSPSDAARTVEAITSSGMIPTVLEYIDGDAVACSNSYEKTEGLDEAAAVLLIETAPEDTEGQAEAVRHFCVSNHSSFMRVEADPTKAEHLWKVRRNISKAVKAMAKVRVSEDVAVPNTKFPVLVQFAADMNASSPLRINAFGHAGDGNLHVSFLSETGSEEDMKLIEDAVERLMRRTLELGGTLTGEHGIGLVKSRYLSWEFDPPTLNAMRALKEVFDPQGLLNPHKIFEG
jgi:glycolate oxidase